MGYDYMHRNEEEEEFDVFGFRIPKEEERGIDIKTISRIIDPNKPKERSTNDFIKEFWATQKRIKKERMLKEKAETNVQQEREKPGQSKKKKKIIHIVRNSDNLYHLANSVFPDVTIAQIREWNPQLAYRGPRIGEKITIITRYWGGASKLKTLKEVIYFVKKDDTVFSIANKFKVKQSDLRDWNNIPENNKISVGQKLTIKIKGSVKKRLKPQWEKELDEFKRFSVLNNDKSKRGWLNVWVKQGKYTGDTNSTIEMKSGKSATFFSWNLPNYLKLKYSYRHGKYIFFTILEGKLRRYLIAIEIKEYKKQGIPHFQTNNIRYLPPARVTFTIKKNPKGESGEEGTVKLNSIEVRAKALGGLKSGTYYLEIAYEKHEGGIPYIRRDSPYAQTWFRIRDPKSGTTKRFLHIGLTSLGCVTIGGATGSEKDKKKWDEFYKILIRSRKGKNYVGTLRVINK